MIKNETVCVQMTTRGWGGWASWVIKVVFLHSPILSMPGGLTTIHARTYTWETWVLLWNIWWNADACRSARLSSGRIVLRVTQVAMRGNSCIHPIDLISNTPLLVVKNGVEIVGTSIKWKVLVLTTILVPPTSVFCIFHSPLYLYQFEHNNFFGNIDLEKSCAWNEFYIWEKLYNKSGTKYNTLHLIWADLLKFGTPINVFTNK